MKPLPDFPKPYTGVGFDYDGSKNATDTTLVMSKLWQVMLSTCGCSEFDPPKFSVVDISQFRELYDMHTDGLYLHWVELCISTKLKPDCDIEAAKRAFRKLLTGKGVGERGGTVERGGMQ